MLLVCLIVVGAAVSALLQLPPAATQGCFHLALQLTACQLVNTTLTLELSTALNESATCQDELYTVLQANGGFPARLLPAGHLQALLIARSLSLKK